MSVQNAKEVETDLRNLTLVVGVDGSGKTTFLNGLARQNETRILEPSTTPEAKAFKDQHLQVVIDADLIDKREQLYLGLNREFDHRISAQQEAGYDVATSGSELITKVSHGLMRIIIRAQATPIDDIVRTWLSSEDSLLPDEVVFVHASDKVLRQRIERRQSRGIDGEKFWGFNSPYFLSRYQETWHQVIDTLAKEATMRCVSLDNSWQPPAMTLASYYNNSN